MQKLFYRAGLALALMGPLHETSAQVVVDGINVVSEFYGPFTKNRVEITFSNPTVRNSAHGFLDLRLNETAFIKEFWLEIDGEFKKAETLRFETGSRIF